MEVENIVFVVIDNLRSRNLGCYGYKRDTSPFIDSLAREGVLFENARTTINSTDPSLTSIFSGFYPLTHGISVHKDVPKKMIDELNKKKIKLLPEILKEYGMRTIGIDWLGRWHRRGYDEYMGISPEVEHNILNGIQQDMIKKSYEIALNHGDRIPIKLLRFVGRNTGITLKLKGQENAEFITDRAIEMIEKYKGEPFFLFLHYWDTHAPFYSPERFNDLFTTTDHQYCSQDRLIERLKEVDGYHRAYIALWTNKFETIGEVIDAYDSAIRYIDENLERLITYLKDEEVFDETLIVITADHGTLLSEDLPYFTHTTVYEPTARVPLIMSGPNIPGDFRYHRLVNHTDIVPTILDILDIKSKTSFDGSPLFRKRRETEDELRSLHIMQDSGSSSFSLVAGRYKLILSDGHEADELYDLESDPDEKNNILLSNYKLASILQDTFRRKKDGLLKKGHRMKLHEKLS
ncbi:MAG: sulfatase [Halobacteriota archaeon]|nr:sulfatase [Halobacteriota archaeon]